MYGAKPIIDINRLAAYLQSKRRQSNLTLEEASQQCSVSIATLSRIESRSQVSYTVATLKSLADWLGLPVETFMTSVIASNRDATGDESFQTIDQVEASLRADKNLSPEGAEALIQLVHAAYNQLARGR